MKKKKKLNSRKAWISCGAMSGSVDDEWGLAAVARLVQGLEGDRVPLTPKILSRLFNSLSGSSVLGTRRNWGDYICRNCISRAS